jgi:hypothetical protein
MASSPVAETPAPIFAELYGGLHGLEPWARRFYTQAAEHAGGESITEFGIA